MITCIAIENFKGVAERVELPIRPLTLLFGPNSAGKSTIMHAFHYAREVFERHNLDADRTIAGGEFIDLGGFRNFVHGHDVARELVIRLEVNLADVDMPEYSPGELYTSIFDVPWQQELKTASVEVKIAWDDLRSRPFVKSYEVGLNGQRIGLIEAEKANVVLRSFDFEHPVFMRPAKEDAAAVDDSYVPIEVLRDRTMEGVEVGQDFLFHLEQADALPPCDRALQVYLGDPAKVQPGYDAKSEHVSEQREFLNVLSQVFVGMAEVVRDQLQRFCYVGPLREKPPREYATPRYPDPSRWATGLGAWDALQTAEDALIFEVNVWLGKEFCLDTGYTIWPKELLMLDSEEPLYASLVSHRAFDEIEDLAQELQQLPKRTQLVLTDRAGLPLAIQDVGEGIAQVLPVVVAALRPDAAVVQIEQPELHLHPRQQAALGDLLIRGALGEHAKLIIAETHSEHLVLRVLRRIRQTAKGEKPEMGIAVTPKDVAVYYVQIADGQTKVIRIDVDDRGEFVQPWPDDFFEIDFNERFG